jgi:hypothetical protein
MLPDDDPNTADLAADELESLSFGSSSCSRSASTASCSTSSSGPLPLPLPPRCATPSSSASAAAASGSAQAIPRIGSVSLSDIRFLRRLGAGDNGSVYLAEVRAKEKPNSGTGAGAVLLAAKVMEEGRARTEREILEAVDHPFLPRLYGVAEEEREEGWGTICQRTGAMVLPAEHRRGRTTEEVLPLRVF